MIKSEGITNNNKQQQQNSKKTNRKGNCIFCISGQMAHDQLKSHGRIRTR